jgi:hypothetical protein
VPTNKLATWILDEESTIQRMTTAMTTRRLRSASSVGVPRARR